MRLDDISIENRVLFTRALKRDDAWRRVARALRIDLHVGEASSLVPVLMSREKTVEELQDCLRDLELYDALSFISERERLRIVREPYCVESEDCFWDGDILFVREGGNLHLKIDAVGSPMPSFQWFHENAVVSAVRDLIIPNFCENMEGMYHCSLLQLVDSGTDESVVSEDVSVRIKIINEPPRIIHCSSAKECRIEHGQDLVLLVKVSSPLKPYFRWWHNNKHLTEGHDKDVLQIKNADENCAGKYVCCVKNRCGEDSKVFKVEVKEKRPLPSEKRALIISICDYKNENKLFAPHKDAQTLHDCLSEANFQCTMLIDESAKQIKEKIKEFFKTLKEGAYVIVYFAGHGFMANNTSYLVGRDGDLYVGNSDGRGAEYDANLNARSADQLAAQHDARLFEKNADERGVVHEGVFEEVLEFEPLFFVTILDMCLRHIPNLKFEPEESIKKYKGNVMKCYATSQNREAYEGERDKHSVYVKNLQHVVQEKKDLTFCEMIKEVTERVQKETENKQIPMFVKIGSSDFRLSDAVSTTQKRATNN